VDTSLEDLAPAHKEEYILLVAYAYLHDGDLERAQARLGRLGVPNVAQSVSAAFDNLILAGRDEADIQTLASLANALEVTSPQTLAYLATPTPFPTSTSLPTPTPTNTDVPTLTAVPTNTPTQTSVPSDTPVPTPLPTDTPLPTPTRTSVPPTNTPKPTTQPKPTVPPAPSNTPKPTSPPAANWTWSAWLVGPGQDSQGCEYGNLQIRVSAIAANGSPLGGVWVYDHYSSQYQVTGNVDSPDWGPGDTKFEYGIGGGGKLCIAGGQGGGCVSDSTRDMPCYNAPPFEDLWAAGYCECCEVGISKERCKEFYDNNAQCMKQPRHYSWRVVFTRSW
jgi:hypothetical protein